MKKFIIQSKKGITSIMEVEIELVKPIEDPSVLWLKSGEYRAHVLLPTSLHQKVEKTVDGKKETTMVPDVWCWHAFYATEEAARAEAELDLKREMERSASKGGAKFDVIACIERCKEIKTILL